MFEGVRAVTADVGILTAFGAGLLSFLSPCILPLVPPYLCFLAGVSLQELVERPDRSLARRAVLRALAFVLGFSTVFVALGASASAAGQLLADHVGVLSRVAGIVIAALGLHLIGVFRWMPLLRDVRVQVEARPQGVAGAFLVGLAFAFGWTPCVGPVLASILLLAGGEDEVARGAWLLAAYAAGIGLPFVAAAFFTGPFLRLAGRFRRHLRTVEATMGLALVATGLVIFGGWMPLVGAWLTDAVPVLGRIG
ncbi:cytochrome c biogenesis CcdA family protein [Methylobacterium oxalidis]|uniref:cytochrome c biogenesis CcdA family protein n=1 Tax=Methylobacterium oxalidis TaxID=944322 RepID=UPI003314C4E6